MPPFTQLIQDLSRAAGRLALLASALLGSVAVAQDAPAPANPAAAAAPPAEPQDIEDRRPIYEQQPFDRITLDEQNKNAVLKVVPFAERKVPSGLSPEAGLTVRLFNKPGREFRILWKHITKVELYEQILMSEATRLMAEGKLDDAFPFLMELKSRYPTTPGLNAFIEKFLVDDSVRLFRANQLSEALAVLEELRQLNPSFKLPNGRTVIQLISAVADKLVSSYIAASDYRSARILLQRLAKDYADNSEFAAVTVQTQSLVGLARSKRDEAQMHLEAKRYKEAQQAIRDMFGMWPTIEGGEELNAELYRQYPLVTVGVAEFGAEPDVRRIENWAARRTGRLTQRSLLEFAGAGPEGGRYVSPIGICEKSEDRTRLTFRVDGNLPGVSGMWLARRLLALADPNSAEYSSSWAAVARQIQVRNVNLVEIDLRNPHVLPEAFLQVPIEPPAVKDEEASEVDSTLVTLVQSAPARRLDSLTGQYRLAVREQEKVEFVAREREAFRGPAEVVERYYAEPQRAIAALRRGDIDVIDRIYPADAARLIAESTFDSNIVIAPYASPTLHLLIPNQKNPHLANLTFRRALSYSIDRAKILADEFLGNRKLAGCRTISGPFPAPMSDSDSLAYAYDDRLAAWPSDRTLGKLLTILAGKELEEVAKRRKEAPPELKELVLAHPASETSRVGAQTVAAYWKTIGVNVKLVEFPPGVTDDPDRNYDLLYAEVMVYEPLVDAKRLFGHDGFAPAQNAYVRQALRNVDQSLSWRDVYLRFQALHQALYDDVSVIPLWQILDHFAYNKRLQGLEERPATLYQSIQDWRVASPPKNPTS